MITFLTSSPCVFGADRAIINPENSFLLKLAKALPDHPKCLYVSSDPDDSRKMAFYAAEIISSLKNAGIELEQYEILDRNNQSYTKDLVKNSDFLILSGGHVPTQNAFFEEIGLREIVKDYQGVIMGISAGTMNAADVVYVQPEEEGESSPDFPRFRKGLNLTKINVLPHYQQVKDYFVDGQRLYEDITYRDSQGRSFLALVDGSYLYTDDEVSELYGEAYLIRDGEITKIACLGEIHRTDELML